MRTKTRSRWWVASAGALLVTLGPAGWSASIAKWTVLGYLSGDGSLEPVALEYLQRLASAPGTGSVAIGAQIDRSPGFSSELGDFTDTRRVVFEGSDPRTARKWRWSDWRTEADMGDPQTLADFLAWGARTLPAEHYAVLLVGHGSGVRPLLRESDERDHGVAYDATNNGDSLTTEEIATAGRTFTDLLGGRKIALLAVDACFSGSAEVAHEAASVAECMTGSPDLLYEPGVPWDQVLRKLCASPDMSAESMATLAVEAVEASQEASGAPRGSYAAARLSETPKLQAAVSALTETLCRSMRDAAPAVTTARAEATRGGLSGEQVDLATFLVALADEAQAEGLTETAGAASEARRALDAVAIASYSGERDPRGGPAWKWSAFFPPNLTAFPPDYLGKSVFARQSGWGAFLEAYLGHLQRLMSPLTTDETGNRT
ncbi:MAG: hypothetical protein FJX75_00465 [Armatimonadetes bacterium]|nr:hypothetical protein [Armatimonadota bacterium]